MDPQPSPPLLVRMWEEAEQRRAQSSCGSVFRSKGRIQRLDAYVSITVVPKEWLPAPRFRNKEFGQQHFFGDCMGVNHYEWAAAIAEQGQRIWFRKNVQRLGGGEASGLLKAGTFVSSYLYDGIIARVYEDDPDELIEHSLFLDLGDEMYLAKPEP